MNRPGDPDASSRRWSNPALEDEISAEPKYAITVVAARCGIHVQTVRRYEAFGLIDAARIGGGRRLYSDADVARVLRIKRLIDDLGVNLAGVAAILHLREQLIAIQREMRSPREYRPRSDRDL